MKLFEIKRLFKQEDKKIKDLEETLYLFKTGVEIPKEKYSCKGGTTIEFRKLHTEKELLKEIELHMTHKEANAFERGKSKIIELSGTPFGIQIYSVTYYKIDPDLLPKREKKKVKDTYKQLELNLFGKAGIPQPIILYPALEERIIQTKKKISSY